MKHASYTAPELTPVTAFGMECSAKIKEILSRPKPTGNYWAKQVMQKVAAGEHVTLAAYDLAKNALRFQPEREPGEDREEDDEQ